MAGAANKRVMLKTGRGLAFVAFWQVMAFAMLILLAWTNEVLDFSRLFFGTPRQPLDVTRGCLATAGILFAGVITVGNTYLQQRQIVCGLLTICAYCKKIRIATELWQQIEEYIGDRSTINFSHSICPECLEREKAQLDKA